MEYSSTHTHPYFRYEIYECLITIFEVGAYAVYFCTVYFIVGYPAVSLSAAGHDIHDYPDAVNSPLSSY